jgi:[ribosomal protein S18]-alanine N-acetyltransferase
VNEPLSKTFIRPMVESDLDHVLEIAASLPEAPHWPSSAYLVALNPQSPLRRIALVAEFLSPKAIQGFAVASLVAPSAELESIAVACKAQRLGLGRQLFHSLTLQLKQAGCAQLAVEVRASNRAALAFYRSLEMIETGLRRRYYTDPIEDAVLMVLQLA